MLEALEISYTETIREVRMRMERRTDRPMPWPVHREPRRLERRPVEIQAAPAPKLLTYDPQLAFDFYFRR